ncbi:hypothetical protein [Polyangium aurulentum]|uniref:hypothetical protein n=1 Tax=Polyangium aurulentum TaxID=2567896 RepID=UPI001F16A9FB|nr:hypothetical protein [Polyangium aurulentum]
MVALTPLQNPAQSFCWVAPVSDSSELASEDPLALDYVAQQVGLLLLPALTTRSSRAQAYAMVAYGLDLAERAIALYGYAATDETRRELFERWERFWALATFELKQGQLPRGDWDAMRGVRGARSAWRPGTAPLQRDFKLISRQQELGNLGAYLVPLRRAGLVMDGSLRPSPAALEIIDAFWDELGENKHRSRYDDYALLVLQNEQTRIERANANLTLARVGERSRLTSLIARGRVAQQRRLFEALFERARDPYTFATSQLVEVATRSEVFAPRDVLDGAIEGRFGSISDDLRALLVTARRFGEVMQALVAAFDRIYASLDRAGWIAPRDRIARESFDAAALATLTEACAELLSAPRVDEIRRLPVHGAACLRLAEDLRHADGASALDLVLAHHAAVQRDRRRGEGWIRSEAGKLVLVVTSYTARPDAPRYPSFKLDVVRTLLVDVGRLPAAAGQIVAGVEA